MYITVYLQLYLRSIAQRSWDCLQLSLDHVVNEQDAQRCVVYTHPLSYCVSDADALSCIGGVSKDWLTVNFEFTHCSESNLTHLCVVELLRSHFLGREREVQTITLE